MVECMKSGISVLELVLCFFPKSFLLTVLTMEYIVPL